MSTYTSDAVPDLSGSTAIVTGGSGGIGAAAASALAAHGARVVLAVRDPAKGARAASAMPGQVEVRGLDLADLASVRAFADAWEGPVDLLVNNAGVSVPERRRTRDGFELQVGTNHLGPFALTNLLLPRLTGRVVSLSSQAERMGRLDPDDLSGDTRPYSEARAYAGSKLAVLLFTAELQRRLDVVGSPVRALAAHPGYVATGMTTGGGRVSALAVRLLAQSPAQGALPVLHAATSDLPGGSFTGPEHALHMRGGAQLIGRSRRASDPELARRVWTASEALTGVGYGLGTGTHRG